MYPLTPCWFLLKYLNFLLHKNIEFPQFWNRVVRLKTPGWGPSSLHFTCDGDPDQLSVLTRQEKHYRRHHEQVGPRPRGGPHCCLRQCRSVTFANAGSFRGEFSEITKETRRPFTIQGVRSKLGKIGRNDEGPLLNLNQRSQQLKPSKFLSERCKGLPELLVMAMLMSLI